MKEFSGADRMKDKESELGLTDQKKGEFSLSDELIREAENIIEEVISGDTQKEGLKRVLLLRDSVTGLEPTSDQMKSSLWDMPAFILGVHSQYLYAKSQRERWLSVLRPEAQKLITDDRMKLKAEGVPLSTFGQITKDDVRDKLHTLPNFSDLQKWEKEEEQLEKLVSLLERRSYEIGKMIDIELRGV